MSLNVSLQTLPIELVYRIFEHLREKDLFLSISNVCQRLNLILGSYQRFRVNQN